MNKNPHAVALGRKGGRAKSEAKAACLEIEVLHALIDSRWLFCGLTPEEVEELHCGTAALFRGT